MSITLKVGSIVIRWFIHPALFVPLAWTLVS
jgi:hypothetical protein